MKTFLTLIITGCLIALPVQADIVWGIAGPYTGGAAEWGTAQITGVKQAVADINAAGGINGQKIVLKIYDDACDPKQAVSIANKIISEGIHFAQHSSCSAASLASLKTYTDEGIVVINTMSTNPKITDGGAPTVFRGTYRDDAAAEVLANEILKHDAQKKIAIVNDKSAYGLGLAQYVQSKINKGGVKEILFDSYDPTNHDYSVLVTKLKQLDTEVLFIGGYPVEEAIITRQLREAGMKTQIMASDMSTPDYWKITGPMGEGALFATPVDSRKLPGTQNVIAEIRRSGGSVDNWTLYAYASTQALAQAMAKAGNFDPAKVAAMLHKEEFKTVLGSWSFDDKGDVRDIHLALYHWHDGQYSEVGK